MWTEDDMNIWFDVMREDDPDVIVDLLGISSATLLDVFREEAEEYWRKNVRWDDNED